MNGPGALIGFCDDVRFRLDAPCPAARGVRVGLTDFVARVRSKGLPVTANTAPSIHAAVERVAGALNLAAAPEAYVVNDPHANACAPIVTDKRNAVLVLSSGMISLLSPDELDFKIGHELGHLAYGHNLPLFDQQSDSEYEALEMRAAMRYAEISADRIGLVCAKSLPVAARVMLKMAGGLPDTVISMDIDSFVQSVEESPEELSRRWNLTTPYPALPFRLWALSRFSNSGAYAQLSGQGQGGLELKEIDGEIAEKFAAMGDGRLEETDEELYLQGLVWAGLALVMDDDIIEEFEIKCLDQLVGRNNAQKAVTFAIKNGRDPVHVKMKEVVNEISESDMVLKKRFFEALKSFGISLNIFIDDCDAGKTVHSILFEDV